MTFLLDFVFPRICPSCENPIFGKNFLLCTECSEQIELLDPKNRCLKCFNKSLQRICSQCRKNPSFYHQKADLFEKIGANQALIHAYRGNREYKIFPIIAAMLLLQIERLKWQIPDIILIQALSCKERLHCKRRPIDHLAHALSKRIEADVVTTKKLNKNFTQKVVLALECKEELPLFPKKYYSLNL
ncbi:MAG: hypothetical protein WDZ28_02805 [Simkaniaceae bacterium]